MCIRDSLERFAPFIKKAFPETADHCGMIESPLTEIEKMRAWLAENENAQLAGKLFLKRDSDLPVAGSVKAVSYTHLLPGPSRIRSAL